MGFSYSRFAVLAFCASVASAVAETDALVIGNPSANAPTAFDDSSRIAEALKTRGIQNVSVKRELGADALSSALREIAGKSDVLIYFAGPIRPDASGGILMGQGGGDRRTALGSVLEHMSAAGTKQVTILIEDCAGGDGMAGRLSAPDLPQDLSVFIAATAGPEGSCSATTKRLTDRLIAADSSTTLREALADVWVHAGDAQPVQVPDTETAHSGQDIIEDDVIILSPAVTPVSASEVFTPAVTAFTPTNPVQSGDISGRDGSTAVFIPPSRSQLAAIPVPSGKPQPSIIVGIIEPQNASFPRVDDTPLDTTATEITYDNYEARKALRAQDTELFKALVESGAFDPPDVELARAIQTELQRMGCYTSSVDGIWGGGSRRSVSRYFAEIEGVTPASNDPSAQLFRQIIMQDEVNCPAPVAAAAAPSSSRNRATNNRPRTQAATPPRAATPTPRAPAQSPRQSSGGGTIRGLGAGVFR